MTDPYTNTIVTAKRLFKEWQKHPKLIIAVDFDSTLYDYEQKGATHEHIITVLKKCDQLGFYVVLWSASKPERFAFMLEYAQSLGIEIASINENPIPLPFGNDKKIYYNILLDDRAGLGQALDTLEIVIELIEAELLCESKDTQDTSPPTICQTYLMNKGEGYPRTCPTCTLGPCKFNYSYDRP